MNNQSILRYGAVAAVVSAALYIVSIALWMSAGVAGTPPPAAGTAYAVSSIVFLATLFALYTVHRGEAPGLSLVAVLLLAVSMVASLFIDPTNLSNPLVLILTACYGVGALLLGWLAYRSPRLPNGTGILALLMGILTLIMIPFIVAGSADLVGIFNLIVGLLYVVWLLWLAWVFFRGTAAAVQAA